MNPFARMSPLASLVIAPLIAAAVVATFGCASGPRLRHRHDFALTPGEEFKPELRKAVLIPIDYTNEDPVKGLDIANERIATLVVEYFRSKGVELERADPKRFREVESATKRARVVERKSSATDGMAEKLEFGDSIPEVLEQLKISADLVVSVNVLKRNAIYTGTRTISWDGIKRRESTGGIQISGGGLPVVSLYVEVHRKDGGRVFWGYGGVEAIFKVDIGSSEYTKRPDLLQDERNIREGICVAFYPYFGRQEYCVR